MNFIQATRDAAARARCPLARTVSTPVRGHYDAPRLRQLLKHLLDNAIKFGAGHPIEVRVERVDDKLFVTISDHGVGVSPAAHERVFERFQRAVSAQNYGGFGLGLWAARQLAEAHGGGVEISPNEGPLCQGSCRLHGTA